MEGLYLHNLIFRAMFADSDRNILSYIIIGWGKKNELFVVLEAINVQISVLPLFVVGAWVATRLTIADELCWTKADNKIPFLIIQIPTMVSVVVS